MTDKMLIAMIIILAIPYLIWRLGRTEYWAPLVVVQILLGLALGPGMLGAVFPKTYEGIFTTEVLWMLSGIASWGVILFVWLAGLELDLSAAWAERRDGMLTAGCALVGPMMLGGAVGALMLWHDPTWMGTHALPWQFVAGTGLACSVTALPILILFMKKMDILDAPLGQRVLRYASLDDLAIWGTLALIVLDFGGLLRQASFMIVFALCAGLIRWGLVKLSESDRWFVSLIWLAACAWGADWAGLHFMVGAFLAGVIMDRSWFNEDSLEKLRDMVLLILMPVFFLSTGLKTEWSLGGASILWASGLLLLAAVFGKHVGVRVAGYFLGWHPGEAKVIAWLLQTKALIMIIFANILLDKAIISSQMFTALLLMAAFSTMLTIPMVMRSKRQPS